MNLIIMRLKLLLFILLFFLCLSSHCNAQFDSTYFKSKYYCWVIPKIKWNKKNGVLYSCQDSSISLLSKTRQCIDRKEYYDYNVTNFDIKTIKSIEFRKKNSIKKGMLIGGITGFTIGFAAFLKVAQFNTNPFLQCIPAVSLLSGLGLGVLLGSIKIIIPINGRLDNYNVHKGKLNFYRTH